VSGGSDKAGQTVILTSLLAVKPFHQNPERQKETPPCYCAMRCQFEFKLQSHTCPTAAVGER